MKNIYSYLFNSGSTDKIITLYNKLKEADIIYDNIFTNSGLVFPSEPTNPDNGFRFTFDHYLLSLNCPIVKSDITEISFAYSSSLILEMAIIRDGKIIGKKESGYNDIQYFDSYKKILQILYHFLELPNLPIPEGQETFEI